MTTLVAPAPGLSFQVSSGAQYIADSNSHISAVPTNDIRDLVNSGCMISLTTYSSLKVIDTTTYALVPEDHKKRLIFTSETEVTLIVPFGLPAGYENREIVQMTSAGDVLPTAAPGVTINSAEGYVKTLGQNATISLIGIAQDVYVLTGEGSV